MSVEERLRQLGISLPAPPSALASYAPYFALKEEDLRSSRLIYVSGQLPLENGKVKYAGKLPRDLTVDQGIQSAKLCAINALSVLRTAAGSLDAVQGIVRVEGFVNSDPEFTEQAKVVNGASDLLVEIFGEKGKHSRFAVGVSSLPLNAATEIALIALVRS
ncbi:MAG: RidA family protein [TACK group archaeon]|nr:RidA family protein [TACK group archaeon]